MVLHVMGAIRVERCCAIAESLVAVSCQPAQIKLIPVKPQCDKGKRLRCIKAFSMRVGNHS